MSESKLVSPLLDGFVMGEPMSSHDGVRCCPAMRENSDEKYIVKIVSVPASQRQLDALLLTGAYKDPASATEYFKELSDGVVKEAMLLQQLSKLEGFLPYEGWQIVPMEGNDLGYEVYLVSAYKRSLEKHLRRSTMTHLGAVNLGLDLCAALSICRRSGYMYVDLKPANIFLVGDREYRIGDLGFVKLNSLKYTSMPTKYRSCYTPPEMHDAMATLNPTADIYAVGMILYQIYNNNQLPFKGKAPAKELPAPLNADYEMAEIILKAIAPNPRNRYQTPIEMGQALVSYMQRNTVNDVPIVPPAAEPVAEAPAEEPAAAEAQTNAAMPAFDETAPSAENVEELNETEMTEEVSSMLAQADELIAQEVPSPETVAAEQTETETAPAADAASEAADEAAEEEEVDEDELDFRALLQDPAPAEATGSYYDDDDDFDDFDDDDEDEDAPKKARAPREHKKAGKGLIACIVILALLAALGAGGYYYYTNYYLLPIDNMTISVDEDTVTVDLTTNADQTLLTVVCTDTYGNTQSQKVTNGRAVFTGLNPDTTYKITVEAEGFHQTSQSCSGSTTTPKQTTISDFTAKTGTEDGSVILSFTVEGPETQDWIVEYSAEDEETKSVSFTGHMVTITGLTVDKAYTFNLIPPADTEQWVVGDMTMEFTASKIVVAENVSIVSCVGGELTAQWNAPEGVTIDSWTVRCYSDTGLDQTLTVTEPTATFTGISADTAYTVEVWASGMTQSARAYITANPTTITAVTVDDSTADKLSVEWTFEGNAPEGGWLLMYTLDSDENYQVVSCAENNGVITLYIPKTTYHLTIQAADGSTVFGGSYDHTTPEAASFNDHALPAANLQASLCKTPSKASWTYKDIDDDDYTTNFSVGDKVSLVLYGTQSFYYHDADTEIMFVIRDSEGGVVTNTVKTITKNWKSMWKNRYTTLDIPVMPEVTGNYSVEVYFNGALALAKEFKITTG